MLSDDSTLLKD